MEGLVVVHVLSAVLGLGPAFAFPFLLRSTDSPEEMKRNVQQVAYLEIFPKLFGTLALLSGFALFFFGSYGPFLQLWIAGSVAVYIAIEILVIGFMAPAVKTLLKRIDETAAEPAQASVPQLRGLYIRVRRLHLWSGALGLLLLALMIVKPD